MEAIGAAASLVTLVATALEVFNDGYDLYKAIDDAPSELQSVFLKAKLVSSTLEQILALRPRLDDGDAELLPLDLRMGLALSLQISYKSLQKLKRSCSRTGERGDLHLRLRWALLEKRAVREIMKQLGRAENDLALILHLIHMYVPRLSYQQPFYINFYLAATARCPSKTALSIWTLKSSESPLSAIFFPSSGPLMCSNTANSITNSSITSVSAGVSTDDARRISLFHSTSIRVVLAAQDALSQDMDRIALNTAECLNRLTPSGRIEEVYDDNSPPVTAQISAQEQGSPGAVEEENAKIVPYLQQSKANRSLRSKSSGRDNDWLQRLGISGALLWYWDQHQSTYIMALRSNLPAMFGHRALNFELAVRQYALSWANMSLLYGSIGISMIVRCTSKISQACEKGDELTVRELIDSRDAGPNDWIGECSCRSMYGLREHRNEPVLFAAVRSRNISLVRYLLANGANVNTLDHEDLKSSLHVAFSCGLLDMARLLVNKGASLNHVDSGGRTVMHELDLPWHHKALHPKLEEAVEKWEHHVALPLVKYAVSMSFEDLDTPDSFQRTPLTQMASQGASNMWFALLRYGAGTPGTRKTFDSEMLFYAASGGNTSIVTSVLESDFPINLNTHNFPRTRSPLHAAARKGNAAVVELILDKGAAMEAKDYEGQTALHEASHHNNMDVVKLLLERGAHVNCTDDIGNTPLWGSVKSVGITSFVEYSNFIIAASWHTLFPPPARAVKLKAFQEVCSCLLQYGADPHVLGWWSEFNSLRGTGYLYTITDVAKVAFRKDVFDIYVRVLAEHYTEIVVDTDRDVFWDAKEEITGEGYGCTYESEIGWQEYNKLLEGKRGYHRKPRGARAA